MMFNHKQISVFYPAYRRTIEVDAGIAPLLFVLWDAEILTCNSCEENEPGIIWIEFYSASDTEKLLLSIIKALGEQIHSHPEANDWFCYRILGQNGNRLKPWIYAAHPNIYPTRCNQRKIYSKNLAACKIELSVSLRFPKEDYTIVLELLQHLRYYGPKGDGSSMDIKDYMELVKIHHSKSELKRGKYMELVKDLEIP
jgi:hypothetical protein